MRRAAALLLLAAACGGGDAGGGGPEPGAEIFAKECTGLPSDDPKLSLPAGFPSYDGWRPNRRATQGKTTVYFGIASVPADDVAAVQQRQRELLADAGYTIVSTDREFQAEAEVHFDGSAEGSAQITPVCRGTVQIRYRFSG